MMISEFSFGWLQEAEEERFARELERRRVMTERAEEQAPRHRTPRPAHGVRRLLRRLSAADGTM